MLSLTLFWQKVKGGTLVGLCLYVVMVKMKMVNDIDDNISICENIKVKLHCFIV